MQLQRRFHAYLVSVTSVIVVVGVVVTAVVSVIVMSEDEAAGGSPRLDVGSDSGCGRHGDIERDCRSGRRGARANHRRPRRDKRPHRRRSHRGEPRRVWQLRSAHDAPVTRLQDRWPQLSLCRKSGPNVVGLILLSLLLSLV